MADRLMALRDRLLVDPAFQRWASRFPLTRRIARRQARSAFDLCAGFVYAQVLHAIVELRLLDSVRAGPIAEAELVDALSLPDRNARLLIDAGVVLGLLSRRSAGRVGLGMLGAAMAANPGISAMVEHHSGFYADLADPVRLLAGQNQNPALARYWPYAGAADVRSLSDEQVSAYSNLMTRSLPMIVDDIIDAYPFARHERIMDVGGGEGEFLLALARRAPTSRLELFDLPAVAARAAARIRQAGLVERIGVTGGNFLVDELPGSVDAVTLVRIVHDHDDEPVVALLSRARRALRPGGALIIAEPMSGTPDTERVADIYFGFYLLAMGSGRPRSFEEIRGLLVAAGFSDIRFVATERPMLASLVVGVNRQHETNVKKS
jgi:demethylspheroidene O-methyltransferase